MASKTGNIMGGIVALAIGGFLFAYLVPPAITALFSANTTGWDAAVISLRVIIPIVIMIAGILLFLGAAGLKLTAYIAFAGSMSLVIATNAPVIILKVIAV